jgi:hypothetical protein
VRSVQLGDYSITRRNLGCQPLLEVGQQSVSFTQLVFEPGHKLTLPLNAPLVFNKIRFSKLQIQRLQRIFWRRLHHENQTRQEGRGSTLEMAVIVEPRYK